MDKQASLIFHDSLGAEAYSPNRSLNASLTFSGNLSVQKTPLNTFFLSLLLFSPSLPEIGEMEGLASNSYSTRLDSYISLENSKWLAENVEEVDEILREIQRFAEDEYSGVKEAEGCPSSLCLSYQRRIILIRMVGGIMEGNDSLRVIHHVLRQEAANRGCQMLRQSLFHDESTILTDVGGEGEYAGCLNIHCSFTPTHVTEKTELNIIVRHPSIGSLCNSFRHNKMRSIDIYLFLDEVGGIMEGNDSLRVIHHVLRQEVANRGCHMLMQSFFHDESTILTDVAEGEYAGFLNLHCSFTPTHVSLSLNIDVSTTMILTTGPVFDVLVKSNQWEQDAFAIYFFKVTEKMELNIIVRHPSIGQEAANRGCHMLRQSFFHDESTILTDVGGEGEFADCLDLHRSYTPTHVSLSLNIGETKGLTPNSYSTRRLDSYIGRENFKWLAENVEGVDEILREIRRLAEDEYSEVKEAEGCHQEKTEVVAHAINDQLTEEVRLQIPSLLNVKHSAINDNGSEHASPLQTPNQKLRTGH
ncbi:hypothetical protein POM88_042375 [Heracleum sosnowskyi]|uniref:Uncharacterized protein n=1 Tax=Heracleum sosnowskyi TaxID=360622 RepID=A0AAD8MBK5_9APIA|nr:hypothetical protein POM88_042375 [Heracleum sosnowskyi]